MSSLLNTFESSSNFREYKRIKMSDVKRMQDDSDQESDHNDSPENQDNLGRALGGEFSALGCLLDVGMGDLLEASSALPLSRGSPFLVGDPIISNSELKWTVEFDVPKM